MKYLITGGCGFLGSNITRKLIGQHENVFVLDNLSRVGSEANLAWLKTQGKFNFVRGDVSDFDATAQVVRKYKPDVVIHLAGQVAATTSFQDPMLDFRTNVLGGFSVLESVRRFAPSAIVMFSSTNKVYGDLDYVQYKELATRYTPVGYPHGFDESTKLDFRTPYGCSKGSTDQYMLDYARVYGLKTVVFRHSSMFGGRQFATYDQGWIAWFIKQAVENKRNRTKAKITIHGNGKQVRDIGFVDDLVECYMSAIEHINHTAGEVYNIGGGMANSLSILELFKFLESYLKVQIDYTCLDPRPFDQKFFVANCSKAHKQFGWKPRIDKQVGLVRMIEWEEGLV